MANATLTYTHRIIQNAVDLNVAPVSNGVDVTYGDWVAGVKKSNSAFTIRYTGVNQTVNSDNSVKVDFTITIGTLTRTVVDPTYPHLATVTASIDGYTFWNYTEPVTSPSSHPGYTRTFSVTVAPLGTSELASIHFYNDMAVADDEFVAGMKIYNPNPPDYRPGMHRVGGSWQSHNRGVGKADKRQSGSWGTMRTQDGPNGTGNPPIIRRGGVWRNQSKIGSNAG